jgi:hypothetical protein
MNPGCAFFGEGSASAILHPLRPPLEYLIGLLLSLAVAGLAVLIGFDRDRSFYPTVVIVIASYYVLFAMMGASQRTLWIETAIACGFSLFAILGFKRSFWFVVVALVAHGLFDFVHHLFIESPGVPHWWPGFCLAFDGLLGALLALRLLSRPDDSPRITPLRHD